MALWQKTRSLPEDQIQKVRANYDLNEFPWEIRHYLAPWIEDKICAINATFVNDANQLEHLSSAFLMQLIEEIHKKCLELDENSFPIQTRLQEAARTLGQRYANNPGLFYSLLKNCIQFEVELVENSSQEMNEDMQLMNAIRELESMVKANEESNKILKLDYEAFALMYHEYTKNNAEFEIASSKTLAMEEKKVHIENQKAQIQHFFTQIAAKRLNLVDQFKRVVSTTERILCKIVNINLVQWKKMQGLAGNGTPFVNNLDRIQQYFECLADIIWNTKEQIRLAQKAKQIINLEEPNLTDYLPQLFSEITSLLTTLVTSSFVIEKQPPQVMKTNTRFTATVRLLIGNRLNVQMNNPQVKVSILSETQASHTQSSNKVSDISSGEILNNTGTMEFQQTTRHLSVSFRNMQLKKIKRAEKKGTESVMDEKFALLFYGNFPIGHGELIFNVWALSLPVVVIVHGNQEPQSWATITWDNAFSEASRIPFQIPDKVLWSHLAVALTTKFKAATGRELDAENLHFLCEKAFRMMVQPQTCGERVITWSQFCKEPLPDRTFTFWEWFYAVMKLTREHLRGPWHDGCVLGFIHKKTAEEMLMKCPNGTFLLRFSDSELGGVTIAWVGEVGDQRQIFMLQPFLSKDFAIRSLGDRIIDLHQLTTLYPNRPKETAFKEYYTPFSEPQSTNGYVKPVLVTHVPGIGNGPLSCANTPQHNYYMQSPDHSRDTPSAQSSYGQQHGVMTGVNELEFSELADNIDDFINHLNN